MNSYYASRAQSAHAAAEAADDPRDKAARVESELLDYEPVPPFRACIGDRDPETFSDYRAANIYARTQSGANRVPVLIRDAADVVIWEIRLSDEPLGE